MDQKSSGKDNGCQPSPCCASTERRRRTACYRAECMLLTTMLQPTGEHWRSTLISTSWWFLGLEIAGKLTTQGAVDLVVIDSVATPCTSWRSDEDHWGSHVGLSSYDSQAMRKLGARPIRPSTVSLSTNCVKKLSHVLGGLETTQEWTCSWVHASIPFGCSWKHLRELVTKNTNVGKKPRSKVVGGSTI